MTFTPLDVLVFIAFYGTVLTLSLFKSRNRRDAADYFLGGRQLSWWLIGVSIVAANISTEQFVGMAGQAAGSIGLAVSAWQLTGAIGIVVIAFSLLPRFLRAGIYTMPEYLEYRYSAVARAIMSSLTVVIYVLVTIAAVLYSGGAALETIFGLRLITAVAMLAGIALLYTVWGGLLAAVWADLLQGTALLVGGLVTLWLGFHAAGGATVFFRQNADKLHMFLPSDHPELPWTVLVGGMWIPIFYYCGLNQFIVQRVLAARSLKQGQLGLVFAAALWLLVPFGIVMPGIVAHQLYSDKLARLDQAYPTLIRELIPNGLRGFIFAALAGAVISTLASVLNSASTIFTMDIYQRHVRPDAEEHRLVTVGRVTTALFLALGSIVALSPMLQGGVFRFIQEFQGYVSPGILAAFLFGIVVQRAPSAAGIAALVLSAPIYGTLQWRLPSVPYLHRMLITFTLLLITMAAISWLRPLERPRKLPVRTDIELHSSMLAKICGGLVVAAVVGFFIAFR